MFSIKNNNIKIQFQASNFMQFSDFTQLQSFKQEANMQVNIPLNELYQFPHQLPHQYDSVLNDIHEINHSRSISSSILDVEPQYDQILFKDPEDMNENEEKQEQEIIFTPSKIFPIIHRKSNMFMSTNSNQEKTQIRTSQENMTGIKVYFFGQPVYKIIQYTNTTTIDSLINKALLIYRNDYSLDQTLLTSNDPKSYEMRFVKDQASFKPDLSVEPVARDRFLIDSIFEVLVLILKNSASKNQPRKSMSPTKSKRFQEENESNNNSENTIKLNIFNEANMIITSLILSKNDTLEKAIIFLEAELQQKIILTENLQDQLWLPKDIDVKNLGTFKLYAKKKKFLDEPDQQKSPLKIHASIPKVSTCLVLPPIGITEASRYQQFEVIKINRRGAQQARVIGVDQTKLYNYDLGLRRRKVETNIFSIFIKNNSETGTKRPQRLISEIRQINSLFGLNFQIVLPEKTTQFRAQSQQDKVKIIRKLKFLIDYNRQFKKV